jgi:hypothetical protein
VAVLPIIDRGARKHSNSCGWLAGPVGSAGTGGSTSSARSRPVEIAVCHERKEAEDVEDHQPPIDAVPEMGVGPPGSPSRGRSQTAPKLLRLRAGVVSVVEKAHRECVR